MLWSDIIAKEYTISNIYFLYVPLYNIGKKILKRLKTALKIYLLYKIM